MHLFLSLIFLLLGCLTNLLFDGSPVNANDVVALPFTLLALLCMLQYILKIRDKNLGKWLALIVLVRYCIMLWNVYGREILLLPGVGTDTEGFFQAASNIARDPSLIHNSVYGSWYSRYLGLVYIVTGPSYLLGSYLNFSYGIFSILIMFNILSRIDGLSNRALRFAVILFAVEPNNMILCSSLRRESLMALFLIISFKRIFQWSMEAKTKDAVMSFVFLLLASVLHGAVISLGIGYIFILLFFNPGLKQYVIKRNTVFIAVIIVLSIAVIISQYSRLFLNRLVFNDENTLLRRLNRSVGSAAYLKNIKITSFSTALLYMPLKTLYFLFSPMPWDWRGISDIIAFMLDSMVYMGIAIQLFRNIRRVKHHSIMMGLFISLISCVVIYAGGTQNAANAMRHRSTLLALFIVVTCLSMAHEREHI